MTLFDDAADEVARLVAQLDEAERYARDLERTLAELAPAATLTFLRAGIDKVLCGACHGTGQRWFLDRRLDQAAPRLCDACRGSGEPAQLAAIFAPQVGWIEGDPAIEPTLLARGVKLGPMQPLKDGIALWNDCTVPSIDCIDDLWGVIIWSLFPRL